MRYHSTRTSSSLGRGVLDSVQKLCFQCSLAQRGQPQGFLPRRCHGTHALGQAAVPSQRHSPSHAPSQEAHSKAFRPRVLKFNLIFSIHVCGWEKAAESESRGEVPPGRCLWSQLYQRESYFSASRHCDLQHGAGLTLGSHSVFHERFLSHRPKSSSFVLAVGDQGKFILEGRACSCLTKVFTSATGRDVQLALGGDPHSVLHPTSVLPSSLAQQPDLSASQTPSGHQAPRTPVLPPPDQRRRRWHHAQETGRAFCLLPSLAHKPE